MCAFKYWPAVIAGLFVVVSCFGPTPAATQTASINVKQGTAGQPITLRDRLIVGLQARLKSEVAFCDAVVLQVNLGHLPIRVVDETFLWARERAAPARNGIQYRPIVYFQPAMIARAKRLRVTL